MPRSTARSSQRRGEYCSRVRRSRDRRGPGRPRRRARRRRRDPRPLPSRWRTCPSTWRWPTPAAAARRRWPFQPPRSDVTTALKSVVEAEVGLRGVDVEGQEEGAVAAGQRRAEAADGALDRRRHRDAAAARLAPRTQRRQRQVEGGLGLVPDVAGDRVDVDERQQPDVELDVEVVDAGARASCTKSEPADEAARRPGRRARSLTAMSRSM